MANHGTQPGMTLKLKVWRQKSANDEGKLVDYTVNDVSPDMSFLEMLDVLNTDLVKRGEEPIAFDHDCREGICGSCGFVVNGDPHGPDTGTALCQLHMRRFKSGEELVLEPFRAKAFPVLKDLFTDRSALDRIIAAGGYISASTGSAQDANSLPIRKENADRAMDAAACIGCGACVAACKNASARLFMSAKIMHLALLPQGQPEREERVINMIGQHDTEGFGACSFTHACEAACPKEISVENIVKTNKEYIKASLLTRKG